ncbi:MAG: septum formation protein Maf [Candidatus Gastranaerophilales bacterium]|nr:septum formation protein Maf [Candidatus Gastranaerophilales bacterium]
MEIILASASPRRKEILSNAGFTFEVMPSNYDEKINGLKYTSELVENCAYQKALDVKNRIGDKKPIVSADTVVVLDDIILGKPKDKSEAIKMLQNLSNNTHFVATSICILYENNILKSTAKTFVTFRELSNDDILNYLETKKPYDKAGSYGIQDEGFDFAQSLDGELNNVIGFPIELFNKMMSEISH